VAAQRLQEATGHSAERSTRTRNSGINRRAAALAEAEARGGRQKVEVVGSNPSAAVSSSLGRSRHVHFLFTQELRRGLRDRQRPPPDNHRGPGANS
uniref:Uncharacterized protein n=1 Tax=Spermophilus dauricus TaxID=99837 RepID=A0A8C9P503_SPEDA